MPKLSPRHGFFFPCCDCHEGRAEGRGTCAPRGLMGNCVEPKKLSHSLRGRSQRAQLASNGHELARVGGWGGICVWMLHWCRSWRGLVLRAPVELSVVRTRMVLVRGHLGVCRRLQRDAPHRVVFFSAGICRGAGGGAGSYFPLLEEDALEGFETHVAFACSLFLHGKARGHGGVVEGGVNGLGPQRQEEGKGPAQGISGPDRIDDMRRRHSAPQRNDGHGRCAARAAARAAGCAAAPRITAPAACGAAASFTGGAQQASFAASS